MYFPKYRIPVWKRFVLDCRKKRRSSARNASRSEEHYGCLDRSTREQRRVKFSSCPAKFCGSILWHLPARCCTRPIPNPGVHVLRYVPGVSDRILQLSRAFSGLQNLQWEVTVQRQETLHHGQFLSPVHLACLSRFRTRDCFTFQAFRQLGVQNRLRASADQ